MAYGHYQILLTESQAEHIRNKAKEAGKPFGTYIRETMLMVTEYE